MTTDKIEKVTEAVAKKFADEGKLIEAGWAALQIVWLPGNAPESQVKDLRWAFMAGAQHLFASMMGVLDEGEEPTDDDMKRIDLIRDELEVFRVEMEMSLPTKGNA